MIRSSRRVATAVFVVALLFSTGCSRADSSKTSETTATATTPTRHVFDPAKWTVEDGLSGALIVGVEVSPDGSEVAYTAMRAFMAGDLNEWTSEIRVAGANGSNLRQVGSGMGMVSSPSWSPDGSSIAFLAPVADGDLKGTQQVFLEPSEGGAAKALTAVPNGVISFEWSPTGERLGLTIPDVAVSKPGPGGPEDDAMVEGADATRVNLWVVDVATSAEPTRVTDGDYAVEGYDWSPDGKDIAFTHAKASEPQGWHQDISVVQVESGQVATLAATPAAEIGPEYSPDGSTIAFIRGESPTADFSAWRVELVAVPGASGGITKTLGGTPNEFPMLIGWSADGQTIFFDEALSVGHVVGALPVSGDAPVMLTKPDKLVEAVSLSDDGSTLGFAMQEFVKPQEAYMAPAVTSGELAPKSVSRENEDVAKMTMPKAEVLHWESTGGMQVEGILTYPLGYEKGKHYPLVLSVHGGPAEKFSLGYFGQPDVYPYAVWASRGYAVLRINPRGSGGYGAAFRKANIADWDGGPYDDLMTGVDKVVAVGVADPDQLSVVGWSYGGHMTANITTRTQRFRAAVVGAGPVNLASQAGTSDLPEMVPAYLEGYPWQRPDVYRAQSPIFNAGKVKTPTLILHGADDTRVPYSQAEEWHAALRALGVKRELVAYPRSGHVVREPQLMKDIQLRILDWITEHDGVDGAQ